MLYTLRAPTWLRDQLVHGVPPELGPSRAKLPHTGTELVAWRKERGWSQAKAAAELGLVLKTLQRAELGATKALGKTVAQALKDLGTKSASEDT